jgi:drug/metabolite transporter (DMT)-like permease
LKSPDPGGARHPIALGLLCGVAAALCWAAGFVAARHGVLIGLTPSDIALHRYIWAGLVLTPVVARAGLVNLGGIGWGRALALTLLAGPLQAMISYAGFVLVPLGHGGVIQPACAVLGGILLATWALGEPLPLSRVTGAALIVAGLVLLGAEAFATIGAHGVGGDMLFITAGLFWAVFGMLLRRWRIDPTYAAAIVSVLGLIYLPVHAVLFGFASMRAAGLWENALQALVQGVFAGAGAIYLYAISVVALGASRAAVFPALVPPFTLAIGFFALGEVPSLVQLAGLAAVAAGFHFAMKA